MDLHMKAISVLLAFKFFKILKDFGVPKSFSLLFRAILYIRVLHFQVFLLQHSFPLCYLVLREAFNVITVVAVV